MKNAQKTWKCQLIHASPADDDRGGVLLDFIALDECPFSVIHGGEGFTMMITYGGLRETAALIGRWAEEGAVLDLTFTQGTDTEQPCLRVTDGDDEVLVEFSNPVP